MTWLSRKHLFLHACSGSYAVLSTKLYKTMNVQGGKYSCRLVVVQVNYKFPIGLDVLDCFHKVFHRNH